MNGKVNILGVKIDKVSISEAVDKILGFINEDKTHVVCTPNSEMVMAAYKNPKLKEVLNNADLLTADGIGVVYASKIVKNPIAQRAAGFDVACALLEELSKIHGSVYLFGSKPGIAEIAAKNLYKTYPGINICGTADGYFDKYKEQEIIKDINFKRPDVLFVCLGSPKQEFWMDKNKNILNAKVCIGLGGSLDVYAQVVKRAPVAFQKLGLEWLYRLTKEPKRIVRMLDIPKFAATVLKEGSNFKQ